MGAHIDFLSGSSSLESGAGSTIVKACIINLRPVDQKALAAPPNGPLQGMIGAPVTWLPQEASGMV